MKINCLYLFIALIGLTGCATSSKSTSTTKTAAAEKTAVQHTGTLIIKPIGFKKEAYIRDAVKNECNLDGKLAQFIEKNAANQYAQIMTDKTSVPTNAQVLTIEIEQVQGGGGGAWSGGKMVLVNGKLTKNGTVLGNFKGRRFSGGGMFGGYKGTCAILGRCVKVLGKDIAEWLAHPAQGSALGDL